MEIAVETVPTTKEEDDEKEGPHKKEEEGTITDLELAVHDEDDDQEKEKARQQQQQQRSVSFSSSSIIAATTTVPQQQQPKQPHTNAVESPPWGMSNQIRLRQQGRNNNVNNNDINDPSAIGPSFGNNNNDVTVQSIATRVDLESMKDSCYFLFSDKNARLSRFWILLLLASIIATAGIVADSTATVIGAMIVAPLMVPILGVMLSIVLSDGPNFIFSLTLVTAGVVSCWVIGYVFGFCVDEELLSSDTNSQIAGRTLPKIADLIGALATGAVGSIALVRKDISGALPGVSISISLVPPLCVSGLVAHVDWGESSRAFILWLTNFVCIQVTGIIIMYIYRVHKMATRPRARYQRTAIVVILILLGLVFIPLYFTTKRVSEASSAKRCLREVTDEYGEQNGWKTRIVYTSFEESTLIADIIVAGEPPFPTEEDIPADAISSRCPTVDVLTINFVPVRNIPLTNDLN